MLLLDRLQLHPTFHFLPVDPTPTELQVNGRESSINLGTQLSEGLSSSGQFHHPPTLGDLAAPPSNLARGNLDKRG